MGHSKTKQRPAVVARLFCVLWIVLVLCFGQVHATAQAGLSREGGDSPYAGWPVIARIDQAGNDADKSVPFTLDECTAMRLYAVGEGTSVGMDDYGHIERADTSQVVWQMYYFETEADVWPANRRVDRSISLPAGEYRLHFRTDGSHSFDDWGTHAPERRFWGIALYEDLSAEGSTPDCWEYAERPEDLGWSSRRLQRLVPELERMDVAALVIVTDGQMVFEWGNTANDFKAHSMRKSLISALYGIALAQGMVDPSQTLAELGIDDKTPLTEAEKQATVSDLLKARSGVYIPAAGEAASMKASRPARGSHAPGTFWYYNNWDFNALGTIHDQETGAENVYQAFQQRIAVPIGMQDFDIARLRYAYEPQSMHPYYGFRISARDLARFGRLYLQGGAWQGKQIVPAGWVAESTLPHSRTGDAGTYSGYGYMWWIAAEDCWGIKRGAYAASGYGGHTVEVLPDINTVIVVRLNTDDSLTKMVGSDQIDTLINKALIASDRVQDPDRASGACAAQCVNASKSCGYQVLYTEMVRLPIANWMLRVWGVGVVLSLFALGWQWAGRSSMPWVSRVIHVLVIAVFGPVGLLAFWLSGRERQRSSIWLEALNASLRNVTGNLIGVLALIVTFALLIREGNVGPLAVLVPFLVGWIAFRAPLLAQQTGVSYRVALRRSLLAEAMSTTLSLIGILPVVIFLEGYWHPWTTRLDSSLFWLSYLAAAFAGLFPVYPLNLWLSGRVKRRSHRVQGNAPVTDLDTLPEPVE